MKTLNYNVTGVIHLSLEDYYNAGMTSEEAKEIIEKIPDSLSGITNFPDNLHCERQFINGNWNVHTKYTHPADIEVMVYEIRFALGKAMASKTRVVCQQ